MAWAPARNGCLVTRAKCTTLAITVCFRQAVRQTHIYFFFTSLPLSLPSVFVDIYFCSILQFMFCGSAFGHK